MATSRDQLVAHNAVDDTHVVVNDAGERLGVGDRVATRRNDSRLGVANRQTWMITAVTADAVSLTNERGQVRDVPDWYAESWVELAYATTVYGAQGDTTTTGHMVIDDSTSAASAYVGMTRGRHNNTAHLVADSPEQARKIWEQTMSRDRADLGVARARLQALDDIDRYGPLAPTPAPAAPATHGDELTRRREREARHARHQEPTRRPSRSGPGIG